MTQGGGLLQLVATGKQDVFLTGNPQVTWFKMVYRRYTAFSIEAQRMYFDGNADFGQKISCVVPRLGDLLGSCFLVVDLPPIYLSDGTQVGYTNNIGHALIQEISILIGEQEIDKQVGEWMQIWSDLTITTSQRDGFNEMIGQIDGFPAITIKQGQLYIPLRFWFCKNPGFFLPLLALQYHQVRINLTIAPLDKLWYRIGIPQPTWQIVPPVQKPSFQLWGDFVYLDVDERRRFVNTPMEYLIEQVQYTPPFPITQNAASATIKLDFNHPCREFIWVFNRNSIINQNEHFNWTSLGAGDTGAMPTDLMTDAVIQLDGQDRFERRPASYFRLVQPFQRHTVIPSNKFIYVYSFALRPEDIQPSGSLNASRIYNITLQITPNNNLGQFQSRGDMTCTVYATNHNVLRIIDGFGGLLFSV